jgi:predicted RNA-binding protein with PUA-like domain
MTYWLFQGNPKYYRILEALRDLETIPWRVTRYGSQMQPGELALIWMAGPEAGLYALGELVNQPTLPQQPIPDRAYWLDTTAIGTKPQVTLRLTHRFLEHPLRRSDLKQDPLLQDLSVIRQPNCTNYKVTPAQWQRIRQLWALGDGT